MALVKLPYIGDISTEKDSDHLSSFQYRGENVDTYVSFSIMDVVSFNEDLHLFKKFLEGFETYEPQFRDVFLPSLKANGTVKEYIDDLNGSLEENELKEYLQRHEKYDENKDIYTNAINNLYLCRVELYSPKDFFGDTFIVLQYTVSDYLTGDVVLIVVRRDGSAHFLKAGNSEEIDIRIW